VPTPATPVPTFSPSTCTVCADESTYLKKQDYHGADFASFQDVASPADCCKKCEENPECLYWTYGTAAPRKGWCWLKHSSKGHELQDNREAGHVCRSPPTKPPTPAPSSLHTGAPATTSTLLPTKVVMLPTPTPSAPLTRPPTEDPCKNVTKSNVVLALDSSASITSGQWAQFQEFIGKLVSDFPIAEDGMHLGAVQFASVAHKYLELTGNKTTALASKSNMKVRGTGADAMGVRTRMDLAVKEVLKMDTSSGRAVVDMMLVITDGLPTGGAAPGGVADVAFKKAKAAGVKVAFVLIGELFKFLPVPSEWATGGTIQINDFSGLEHIRSQVANKVCGGVNSAPTPMPTKEPITLPPTTVEPSRTPMTDKPSRPPTMTPTARPTMPPTPTPTNDPTSAPTPCNESTAVPTDVPTTVPTYTPTFIQAPPSSLTSIEDLSAGSTREAPAVPSGCLVRAATMHILFNDKGPLISRRLVLAMRNQAFKSHEANLQAVVARKLNLPISHVAVKSYLEKGNIWHTELRFKGLEAIARGYKLEKAVLADTFHPIPKYSIRGLYMKEVFDCGGKSSSVYHTGSIHHTGIHSVVTGSQFEQAEHQKEPKDTHGQGWQFLSHQ